MAATGLTTIYINLGGPTVNTVVIATDSAFTQNVETFSKSAIESVKAVYNAAPGSAYPYPTQTMATMHFIGKSRTLSFELQNVDATGHAAWVTGDQAACTAFTNDCITAGF